MAQTKIKAGGFDADVITGTTALTATPADTDEILISDGGTLKRIDYAELRSSFGNVAFSAKLGSDLTLNDATTTDVVFGDELLDTNSAYNTSDGVFTVPVAGKYMFGVNLTYGDAEGNVSDMETTLSVAGTATTIHRGESTSNGTTHTKVSRGWTGIIAALSVNDEIKVRANADTNNSSTSYVASNAYHSIFWGVIVLD
tara:strand:- start:379 stop:975 length:597 start_codon:yes stop_codon:yes gene_type:complete